jgi:futalosine hydrolase
MEGAAFIYASLSEGIPFIQIRAVSNYIEERDKTTWDLEKALKNLNKVLGDVFREVCL